MKTPLLFTLSLSLILVSCTAATGPTPEETSIPTTTPSSTEILPTEQLRLVLKQDTALLSGPGNADFDTVAILKAGEAVYPLGTYVDYVQVTTGPEGSEFTGFIWINAIDNLPAGLPELPPDSIPLSPLFVPECAPGQYNAKTGVLTFRNPAQESDGPQPIAIPITEPLRIRINGIKVTGNYFGSITLLGRPNGQISWWKGRISMDVGNNDGNYVIFIRDGTQLDANLYLRDLGLSASQTIQIVFEQAEGKSFVILDGNNRRIRRIDLTQQPELNLPDGLFPEKIAYFQANPAPDSSLSISGLQVGTPAKGQWLEDSSLYPGLADLAGRHDLTIGTEFSYEAIKDMRYCRTMKEQYNVAVLNGFSWGGNWLGPGRYDFSYLDLQVNYAVRQGWRVRASHLVWGEKTTAIPDWLKNGRYTRDEYIQFLEQHVKTVVGRYKGRVQEWSIANEAASRYFDTGGADFWNEKIGPEYIEMAFRWAREIDPDGILILNDTNNEAPRDRDTTRVFNRMYDTVKEFKEKGVPIDVVGMEMHLLVKYSSPIPPEKEDVLATMRKFADLGVKIYITEFDVDIHNQPGAPEEQLEFQADMYRDMLEACLESKVCGSFTTWGVSDSTSWLTLVCEESWCMNQPDADPLMFDDDYSPKPAYFAVRGVLLNFPVRNSP